MLSPFLGLSLIMHLLICFMYETAIFIRGLFFGFKKYANKRTMVLVRNREENVLPAMIIGIVIMFIGGIAFFAIQISYQNKPNNFDLVANAIDTSQTYEAPKIKELAIPKESPMETEKIMVTLKTF